ncbi:MULTISPECIES: hypothetical protein [unclassified Chryseobacterium]|uniref:hypothetical protein n=1 Tax=unclassified Chryseobacterium TaxID=2593645 RepID=UPI002853398F|nr:hypothetical protein [Chryseobacterium sp. CFS7]MDR4894959.1 hypothetical protein [Chryseobacterium sp. CFS7]
MKKVFIVLFFLLGITIVFGQAAIGNTQYEKLQTFLKKDSLAFQQFLIAKKCFCRENFLTLDELRLGKKSNNSTKDLYELFQPLKKEGYLFFVAIDVQKLASFFNRKLINEYASSRGRMSDDVNRIDHKNILCETISSQTKYNYSEYVSFINNLDNYAIPMNKGTAFLKEETYLDELYYYYPGKIERWYNFGDVHKIMDVE